MKIKNILLFIIVLCAINLSAQENTNELPREFAISFVPQYVLVNGIRLDVDLKPKNSRNWWILSPYYFTDGPDWSLLNRDNDDMHSYERMDGFGLGLSRKMILTSKDGLSGFYVKLGAEFRYYDIQGDDIVYVETTGADGLPYQVMRRTAYSVIINSYSGNLCAGYQFNPVSNFYIDLFIGFGLKYSVHDSPQNVLIEYNRGQIDYGYTGTQFLAGFRFGVGL